MCAAMRMFDMQYRCEAVSLEGFIQRLATQLLPHGYFFYVSGFVPEGKDPRAVDEKLIHRYGVACSKWARARKKRAGFANLQYVRLERTFVIVATHGEHPFFDLEGEGVRDFRRVSLKVGGYSVSVRGGHAHVRIELEEYRRLKAYLVELATHRSAEALSREFQGVPFEPYAPVRRQLLNILRAVNRERKRAGFEPVPIAALRLRRRIVRPFEDSGSKEAA